MNTTERKTTTCNHCGATGLIWKKSKADRWYLAESVMVNGRYTWFRTTRLHRCPSVVPVQETGYVSVYGYPEGPIENPETHTHVWHPWRKNAGGITGAWCYGCRGLRVD